MQENIQNALNCLKEITLLDIPSNERVEQLKNLCATAFDWRVKQKGLVEVFVNSKPVRVLFTDQGVFYSIRDLMLGAGISSGYSSSVLSEITQGSVLGPGKSNKARYIKSHGIDLLIKRARHFHSKQFLASFACLIFWPKDATLNLLCSLQHLPLANRKEAFEYWSVYYRDLGILR